MITLRVGVLGAGHAAANHVMAARAIAGVEIAAVAARDPVRAREFAQRNGIDRCFETMQQLVESRDIDAVVIALPPAAQPDIAVAAFEAGKHVMCEKLLAACVSDAHRIVAAWRASGCVGAVNFCYRFVPEIRDFRARLLAGECGAPSLVQVDWILSNRLDLSLTHNWKARSEMGGGVLQNFGVHVFDYIFHGLKGVRVLAANGGILNRQRLNDNGDDCEVTGEEHASIFCFSPLIGEVFIHLSLVTTPAIGHRAVAYGDRATLKFFNPASNSHSGPFELTISPDACPKQRAAESSDRSGRSTIGGLAGLFVPVWANFAYAIRCGNTDIEPGIESGLEALRLTSSAKELMRRFDTPHIV